MRQPKDPWPEDPWEVRERFLLYQRDPWEVRERLFRCFRGVSVTAGGLKRGPVKGRKRKMLPRRFRDSRRLEAKTGRARRCFHRLILRVPKATLDILGAYAEDLFWAICGLELDCGKLWRGNHSEQVVYQPEDPWEVRERLLVHQSEDPWPEDPWEVRERLLVTRGR